MNKIKIITNSSISQINPIRGGGEEQSLASNAIKKVGEAIEVGAETIEEQILNILNVFNSTFDKIETSASKYKIDEFSLSLAISAEGNIGLVSAGAEATIEVKFKKTS
jgi:cytochrome oxidase Cu insertion factor (SCO1/SenC/PrrC family)